MGPILDALRELGGSGKPREVCDLIADRQSISDKKLEETLKSGQTRYYNQVHWARQYLVWEGLLDGSTRGVWSLTPVGYKTSLDTAVVVFGHAQHWISLIVEVLRFWGRSELWIGFAMMYSRSVRRDPGYDYYQTYRSRRRVEEISRFIAPHHRHAYNG